MKSPSAPHILIAIDGPVSSGKTSLSNAVAKRLNILHIDTGAMYRAVGLAAIRLGILPEDKKKVSDMCEKGLVLVDVKFKDGMQVTLLNGEDVSTAIRAENIGLAASTVSMFPKVRRYLVERQRAIAQKQSVIMDGRDIGTVVLPNALVKIFLTASAEVRANRRFKQLKSKGVKADYKTILEDLLKRDEQDTKRVHDPLRQAEDAFLLDTSNLSFKSSLQAILDRVNTVYEK
jgi:cytidylate kinase